MISVRKAALVPPPIDIVGRARHFLADRLPTQTIVQHDHQPRTLDIGCWRNPGARQRLQYTPLLFRKTQNRLDASYVTTEINVTHTSKARLG
jgi:hypothetical protein